MSGEKSEALGFDDDIISIFVERAHPFKKNTVSRAWDELGQIYFQPTPGFVGMMARNGIDCSSSTTRHTAPGDKMNGGPTPGLQREPSRESTPSSQANYFDYFESDQQFWAEAAEDIGNDETQAVTPPTSLSSTATNASRSVSHFSPKQVPLGPGPVPMSRGAVTANALKRTASQASLGPSKLVHEIKKPRIDFNNQPDKFSSEKARADLPFINLSPPHTFQRFVESRRLPYSVEWELARMVSRGTRSWDGSNAITIDQLNSLKSGNDTKMSHVEGARNFRRVFCGEQHNDPFASWNQDERNATDPWPELDREEKFVEAHPDQPHQQIGKVYFVAALKSTVNSARAGAHFRIELSQAQLGPSNSFSRRFGSKSFLRLKIPTNLLHKSGRDLVDLYLRKPVILCQSVFRAFYAKDQTVFYFRTNEIWNSKLQVISPLLSPSSRLGFLEFIQWHNPIELNNHQTMAKWAARFALGLSSSIHGVTLKEEEIHIIEDIKSKEGSDMTDGAGFITRHLLQELTVLHDWPSRPSAIQVRVRGSKGLLVENLDLKDDIRGVQLRPSLIKIQYPTPLDETHTTIDILRTSHARSPIPISADVIINLHANGVRSGVFEDLMKQTLDDIIRPLLNWDVDDPKAMLDLWINFERAGSVIKSRRVREESHLARVRGFAQMDTTEEAEEEDEEANGLEEMAERSEEWWPDRVSGCPSALEETVIQLLDSGFRPTSCKFLRDKAFNVVKSTIKRVISKHVINIPLSAGAWIVPDPSGLLGEGQIFFQSSHQTLPGPGGIEMNIVTGDVLITRDPCRLPTDVQKWKAVDIPQLHYLKDIIVLSVQGPRRAADWLAGGDYDGDKAKLIWEPSLVDGFKSADPSFADPPEDLDKFFETENKKAQDFQQEIINCTEEQRIHRYQKYLLGNLEDASKVGLYSNFHNYSTYVNGYANEQTKLLAYLFTTVLDGRKTGKTIKREIFKDHNEKFGVQKLRWKQGPAEQQQQQQSNVLLAKTNTSFIMERLLTFGRELETDARKRMKSLSENGGYDERPDVDLVEPYLGLEQKIQHLRSLGHKPLADAYQADLDSIKTHVKEMCEKHRAALTPESDAPTALTPGFTKKPIRQRQDILRALSKDFHSKPEVKELLILYSQNEVDRIKASFAYHHAPQNRFSWDVAFRILCLIKCGRDFKPVGQHFYDHMVVRLPKRAKNPL